jgi:predicted ArsR family transcriptional regulator
MKTILFYWSKGAETRRDIIRLTAGCERKNKPCYISTLAGKLGLSHVAVKKHVDLLLDEGYVKITNPGGKPAFLALTGKGNDVYDEISSK